MATVLTLHAHPDDEALLTGGWLAQRAALGDRVVLVLATDGEAGLTGPDAVDLAGVRRREAETSAAALGIARVVWLGYDDSGMAGEPSRGSRRFADVPVEEVARRVADLVDEEGATVLTGYDARGGYGHPDHRQVHLVARRAQCLAAVRPRLMEATVDRTWLVRVLRLLRPLAWLLPGLTVPEDDDVFSHRDEVTHCVDVRAHLPAKRAALGAHVSQQSGGVRTVRLLLLLPSWAARRVIGTEWFVEVL